MSRSLQEYLDRVMTFANRNVKDAERIRAELQDHLLAKIADLRAKGLSDQEAVLEAIKAHGHSLKVGCGLRRRSWWIRPYLLAAVVLLVTDYFLLLGRFYWFGFGSASTWVYRVLNFPCSVLYLWLEKKRNPWWHEVFGERFEFIFNDEIGILLAWIIITLLQAMLVTVLLLRIRLWWKDKQFSRTHELLDS